MIFEIDLNKFDLQMRCEILRGLVFKQVDDEGIYWRGCYETFEVQPDFVKIDPRKYENLWFCIQLLDEDITVEAYENDKLVAMWYWDGDGTLLIWIKGSKTAYVSFDCKKDYEWEELGVTE